MAIRFSGRKRFRRGTEPRQEPGRHNPAEDILRPALPPARFYGYFWNIAYLYIFLGVFLGFLFTEFVLSEAIPRRELFAPLFDLFGIEVNLYSLSIIIGGSLGVLIFLLWAGRTSIIVDDRGIEVEGAIRHTLIPWSDIKAVSIGLKPGGGKGVPIPVYTIHREDSLYVFLVDLPRGARQRLCEAIEARGVETSNSFLAGASPLFGLLMIGLPIFMLIEAL